MSGSNQVVVAALTYHEIRNILLHTGNGWENDAWDTQHAKEKCPSVHLLCLYECESGIVIPEAVKYKENEITASARYFIHV